MEHDDGWSTWYAHLDEIKITVGDYVGKGDVIGTSGNSGKSTGPHLHLTAQHKGHGLDGYYLPDVVNPEDYL